MGIQAIKSFFKPSRIEIARNLRKDQVVKNMGLKSNAILNDIAEKQDIFIRFSQSAKDTLKMNMQVFRRGIDHVSDITDYAIKNQTGDQVYVHWEKKILDRDVYPLISTIENTVLNLFGFNK